MKEYKLIRLIYVSNATKEMNEDELLEMLETSKAKNQQENITGMLLYGAKNFMQVIEGEEEKVMNLYLKICKDVRHQNVVTIDISEVDSRIFDGWSMGFKHFKNDEVYNLEYFSEFMCKDKTPKNMKHDKSLILNLLNSFKKINSQ